MRRLIAAFRVLQFIGKSSPTNTFKLIALFLSVPFFKASHFCFQVAYALGEFRFARIRSNRVRLGIEHSCHKVRYLRGDNSLIPSVFDRFSDIKRALDGVHRQA